jgi:hypothetical protein
VQLALGIEQEITRRDDPLAGLEPLYNLYEVAVSFTGSHLARLQIAAAEIHKYGLRSSFV